MLRMTIVWTVLAGAFITVGDLQAQRRPMRHWARQHGVHWSSGYHVGNPGPIANYYSPWSTLNTPLHHGQKPQPSVAPPADELKINSWFEESVATPFPTGQGKFRHQQSSPHPAGFRHGNHGPALDTPAGHPAANPLAGRNQPATGWRFETRHAGPPGNNPPGPDPNRTGSHRLQGTGSDCR